MSRSASARSPRPARGLVTPAEIRPLAAAARRAFEFQRGLGNLDPGETFDDWRHQQVAGLTGKPGLRALAHADYRPVLAHFETLAGRDSAAFSHLLRTGPAGDHSTPDDTRDRRDQLAWLLGRELDDHLARMIAAGLAEAAIGPPYVLTIARSKFRRPRLTWDSLPDLPAGSLLQLLATVRARISACERRLAAPSDPSVF